MATPKKRVAIGIDLGTSYSCVAFIQHGQLIVATNDQGNRTTPSIIAFDEKEQLVGEPAKYQAPNNLLGTIFDVKRWIGLRFDHKTITEDSKRFPYPLRANDKGLPVVPVTEMAKTKEWRAEELSGALLLQLKTIAETRLGHLVTDAVITVPARFSDEQRAATRDAATIAGLNVLKLLHEPTAAALAYQLTGAKSAKKQENVLVFDLGGGTLDVAVLEVSDGVYDVRATGGDIHLGGQDFDARLIGWCIEDFKTKSGLIIPDKSRAAARLRLKCEQAKRQLTADASVDVEIDCLMEGVDYKTTITRARFENLCQDLFQATVGYITSTLVDASIDKKDIDRVILVGGSSRIPKIRELLRSYFSQQMKFESSINPDEAVACGAAIHADTLLGQGTTIAVLVDVCPYSLGIETKGGEMKVLIPRNSHLPLDRHEYFTTTNSDQTIVDIAIYQGEHKMIKDNILLSTFKLSGIVASPNAKPKIKVLLSLDIHGLLTVSAVDEYNKSNKYEVKVTRENNTLGKSDLAKMTKEVRDSKSVADAKTDRHIAFHEFTACMKRLLAEHTGETKLTTVIYVNSGLQWLQLYPNLTAEQLRQKYREIESNIKKYAGTAKVEEVD